MPIERESSLFARKPDRADIKKRDSRKQVTPSPDPIDEALARQLLDPVDVMRDPLHGDIRLTALERFIVDRPEFQRLRHINQLGMTYVSYPGAVHNRFIHSIGTLHVAAEMIQVCNNTAEIYTRLASADHVKPLAIAPYATVLTRLCALMHDMAHVPFGHTLEKEGDVFDKDEWQDPFRVEKIFGEASPFAGAFVTFLKSNFGIDERGAIGLSNDIKRVLTSKRIEVNSLPYPFVHDLVGNTICADLIDYVQRDTYFCGLSERFGDRFLAYLAIMPLDFQTRTNATAARLTNTPRPEIDNAPEHNHAWRQTTTESSAVCRAVLLQYRYNERKATVEKPDVVSEAIDLVRRRLAVAEKLYFHRTKMSASSMLTTAVFDAGLTSEQLWGLSDTEVLQKLAASDKIRARNLGEKLLQRRLHKPIYRIGYVDEDEKNNTAKILWGDKGPYTRLRSPRERAELISKLEELIRLSLRLNNDGVEEQATGSVTISCPDRRMNLKAFEMLIVMSPNQGSEVKPLQDWAHKTTQKEIEAIQETHRHLWRLDVLVDPMVVPLTPANPLAREIAGCLNLELKQLPNEIEDFRGVPSKDLNELCKQKRLEAAIEHCGIRTDQLTVAHLRELQEASAREGGTDADFLERVRIFLADRNYKK